MTGTAPSPPQVGAVRRSPVVLVLRLAELGYGLWLLAAIAREGASLRAPLGALLALVVADAAWHRRALRAATQRWAGDAPSPSDERALRFAVAGLVVVGLALRASNLHAYAFHPDEAQFLWVASSTPAELWRYITTASPHPPLVFYLHHALLEVSWSPLWLRLPSLVGGTVLIWCAYRFGRALLGAPAGLATAWLVAFSPALVELSRVCRNYAPGFAFLVLSLACFASFLRGERWRDFAWFAALATVAAAWHYALVAVLLAVNGVLAVALLTRRRPASAWLRAGLLQLPLAAVMGTLYLLQVAQLPEAAVRFQRDSYLGMHGLGAFGLAPVLNVWRYLAPSGLAELCLMLSLLGAAVLWLRGQRLALLLCALPIALGVLLMHQLEYPLIASRHSAFLFPCLLALAAACVPELLGGLPGLRARLGRAADGAAPVAGALAVGLGLAVYAVASLLEYEAARHDRDYPSASQYGRELPFHYRRADEERAFALLEERAGENDLVLLGFQGLYALRVHLGLAPTTTPTPGQRRRHDLRWLGAERFALQHERNGVRYAYSPRVGLEVRPLGLLRGLDQARQELRLAEPDRVWFLQGAWEPSLSALFAQRHPEIRFDRRVERDSGGWLFSIEVSELRRLAAPGSPGASGRDGRASPRGTPVSG